MQTLTPGHVDLLTSGNYFVEAQSTGLGAWSGNPNGFSPTDLVAGRNTGWFSPNYGERVLKVEVTPEPLPTLALALGTVGLFVRRRRNG